MTEESNGGPPRSFLIISIAALVWNLLGVMSYIMEVTRSPEALAQMPEAEQALIEGLPSWVIGAFAIAVFGGVLGATALLLKKAFIVSLVAIVLQMGYWSFMTNAAEVYGAETYVMPLLVTVIAVFLVWYSRDAAAKGWLK
ncbi:MAG: hypothetical protein ACE5KS_08455 [Woeseiaceae bacterium]